MYSMLCGSVHRLPCLRGFAQWDSVESRQRVRDDGMGKMCEYEQQRVVEALPHAILQRES